MKRERERRKGGAKGGPSDREERRGWERREKERGRNLRKNRFD
jgi:hypothetical protein